MANATKLPTLSELITTQLARYDFELPSLGRALSSTGTTIVFNGALKKADGTTITGGILIGIETESDYVESVWLPVGSSSDGITFTGVVRGVRADGIDYTTGVVANGVAHKSGSRVFCVISAVIENLVRKVFAGDIATGGSSFIIGTDASGTVTVKRSTGTGTSTGFFRWNTSSGKAEYSDDGSTWNSFDAVTASTLVTVSSGDTTPGHLESKVVDDNDTIVITKLNAGGNEQLQFATGYSASKTEIDQALDGISANVTAENLSTLNGGGNADELHTHDGFQRNATNALAGEDLLTGDLVGYTSANTFKRVSPIALPSSMNGSSVGGTYSLSTQDYAAYIIRLSSSIYGVIGQWDSEEMCARIVITSSTGEITGVTDDASASTGVQARQDAVQSGTDKILTVASVSNAIYACVMDLSSSISRGVIVTVDSSNCNYASCCYISDSHVLFIYEDTSLSRIVYAKYTLSGTTLTLHSTGNVTAPSGTWHLAGVRQFLGTDYFLLVIQDDTSGEAKCAIATYDETSSLFTSVGSWYTISSGVDVRYQSGVAFVQLSSTQMVMAFKTTTTNVGSVLITRSGTSLTFGSIINTTVSTTGQFSLTGWNSRVFILSTINATTPTCKILEIDADGLLSTRLSGTPSDVSPASGNLCVGAVLNPSVLMMAYVSGGSGSASLHAKGGNFTINSGVGVVSASKNSGEVVTVISSGYSDDLSGLTYNTKYYADLGGLLTSSSDGTPDKVGIAESTTEIILKSW